ncbi:MAG: hypothetical protein AB7V32_01110 [Candidatus Berkiella sp.]
MCHPSTQASVFGLHHSQFGSLATIDVLKALSPMCLEIDIAQELCSMTKNSALEITVPVLGMTDLLQKSITGDTRHFACPIMINHFCAKQTSQDNFPKPEFVLATDMMGNQYEIVVNLDGTVELPTQGTGLFTLISSITFIYSYQQVIDGFGFDSCETDNSHKLLLLPPENNLIPFSVRTCVTHINERHQRIVDTIRTINVQYPQLSNKHYQSNIVIQREEKQRSDMLNVTVALTLLLPLTKHLPFIAKVSLDPLKGVQYGTNSQEDIARLPSEAHGWMQHPVNHNIFTRYYGLSERTLVSLIRHLYSEYDFIQDYLKGKFNFLSQSQDYNNFLLLPEAFGYCYDMIVRDLVHQKIPGSFLFDKIPEERLLALDTSQIPVDFHDSVVLSQIQAQLQENRFDALKSLFMTENDSVYPKHIESFSIFATGLSGILPQAAVEISQSQPSVKKGRKDKSNQMQTRQAAWTPMLHTQQVDGEQFEVKNQVQVQPFTVVEIDPSHIHLR